MGARLGIVFYWLGVAATAALLLFALLVFLFGGPFLGFLIGIAASFIPFLIGWGLRWLLTGRTDFRS